jgi:glycerol-3-phosphate acyltransferase PlsX
MGSAYMKNVCGVENPRVALLSNGTEEKKGNELNTAVFGHLKALPINFVGNMEARDALSGGYDVLVSDGFAGNIAIKSMEGAVDGIMKMLKAAITKNLKTKMGAALLRKELYKMKDYLDYAKRGGGPFLGIEKILIKNHGSAKAVTVAASISQAKQMAEKDIVGAIKKQLEGINIEIIEG